jgi:hypothetical protein
MLPGDLMNTLSAKRITTAAVAVAAAAAVAAVVVTTSEFMITHFCG